MTQTYNLSVTQTYKKKTASASIIQRALHHIRDRDTNTQQTYCNDNLYLSLHHNREAEAVITSASIVHYTTSASIVHTVTCNNKQQH